MVTTYEYTGKTTEPNMPQIQTDVANSAMTDKSIEWCDWRQSVATLWVHFTNELDAGDKTILDGIVEANS